MPMTPMFLCLACAVAAATASAQGETADAGKKAEGAIAQTARLLDTVIDTKGLQEDMPFAKFLAVLQARLPADKKRSIRLDEKGLGKDYAAIAASSVQLPPVPKKCPCARRCGSALAAS